MSFWERLRASCFPRTDKAIVREVRDNLLKRPQLDSQAFANTYFPEEKQVIARKLWEITKEHSIADITGVVPDDKFVEDLRMDDLDSLSLVELAVHIEKDFNISLSDERLRTITTLSELVDEVYRLKRDGIVSDPSTSSG
jgi:acyl carrier protein